MAHGSAGIGARLDALHEQSEQHRADARRAAEDAHAELLAEREQAADISEPSADAEGARAPAPEHG